MDSKANIILSAAIASHGEQLLTSNAFCKVYLTGYLSDYPQERRILITLKEQELPKALLEFSQSKLTETELFTFIDSLSRKFTSNIALVAWGIDAWAAAIDIPAPLRQVVQEHCFADAPSDSAIKINRRNVPRSKTLVVTPKPEVKKHNVSFLRRTAVAASLIGAIWLIPSQDADDFIAPIAQATPKPVVAVAQTVVRTQTSSGTSAAEMLQQTLISSRLPAKAAPKPMVIAKPKVRVLKTKQLRADIEAYLQSSTRFD